MSRNWRSAAPGGETFRQLAPPSVVRSTVPAVPATHAVLLLTAESPRNRTSAAPLSLSSQCGARCVVSRACAGTAVSAASAAPHAMATAMLRYVRPTRRVVPMRLMAGEASPLPGAVQMPASALGAYGRR